MNATISLPRPSNPELHRKWACDIALEVRDAIRDTTLPFAVWQHGSDVEYRPSDMLVPESWKLVGVYDEDASLSDIADDVELVTEREPMHAAA